MDIFFQDPSVVPLPPHEVRIRELRVEPWPDQRRIRIYLELTPFQLRPSGEISIIDSAGEEIASASIIETMDPIMELTIHLRGEITPGTYSVRAQVYYLSDVSEGQGPMDIDQRQRIDVDQSSQQFELTA